MESGGSSVPIRQTSCDNFLQAGGSRNLRLVPERRLEGRICPEWDGCCPPNGRVGICFGLLERTAAFGPNPAVDLQRWLGLAEEIPLFLPGLPDVTTSSRRLIPEDLEWPCSGPPRASHALHGVSLVFHKLAGSTKALRGETTVQERTRFVLTLVRRRLLRSVSTTSMSECTPSTRTQSGKVMASRS